MKERFVKKSILDYDKLNNMDFEKLVDVDPEHSILVENYDSIIPSTLHRNMVLLVRNGP